MAFLLLTSACTPPPQVANTEKDAPPRRSVRRGLYQSATHRFIYCVDQDKDAAELVNLLHQIASSQPQGKRIEVISCAGISTDSLASGHISIIGNQLPLGAASVLQLGGKGAVFDQSKTLAPEDVLLLPYYRNPWNNGRSSAGIYYSASLPRLVEVLREEMASRDNGFFYAPWAFEIHQPAGGRVYGSFKDSTWNFDAEAEITLSNATDPLVSDGDFQLFAMDGYEAGADTTLLKQTLAYVAAQVRRTFGSECGGNTEVRLYPNLERIGLRTGSMQPAQYDEARGILHLVAPFFTEQTLIFEPEIWRVYTEGCLKQVLTADQSAALVAFAQEKAGKNSLQTSIYNQLQDRALQYATTNVAKQPYPQRADHRSTNAIRMRALARVRGTDGMAYADLLRSVPADEQVFPTQLIPEASDLKKLGPTPPLPNILAGMTFAHEGYRIHNGYGGTKVGPSLDSLAKLGVNALSVVPYTFQRHAERTAGFHISQSAGGENDAATIHSLREAKRRGWYTLLKPQIWVGDGWPGSINVKDNEDANQWFENYGYWIMHYALMAEAEQVDGLVIGTELVRMTLGYPDAWRRLIADIRKVYSGHLTYAANWGEEFEQLTFWEDLDIIGLNSYYPLSDQDKPSDEELLTGAREWVTMATSLAQRTGKPIWLTETGYRSVSQAWKNPHAETNGRPQSDEDQARCYRALTQALRENPGFTGVFIWKWPSYLGYEGGRGREATGFTPGGKSAAMELEKFYRTWLD
ncbi:hypothetical protein A3850_012265 [Lewinella sp. 4G2]|nr:hypothetical protein A3850_012265 [Lewinella sp. 4G2]